MKSRWPGLPGVQSIHLAAEVNKAQISKDYHCEGVYFDGEGGMFDEKDNRQLSQNEADELMAANRAKRSYAEAPHE